jgi:hypothetical protein
MPGGFWQDLGVLARLTRDFPGFVRSPLTLDQARDRARRRLDARTDRFLSIAQHAIYGHPGSPYLELLQAAGCEFGDIKALVAQEGLEGALARLAAAGVYVTFDEFKGRREAVRGSRRFSFRESDFDNPNLRSHFEVRSGGTRGPATAVKMQLAFVTEMAASTALAFGVHGLGGHAHVIWLVGGVTPLLIYTKLGRPPVAWMVPVQPLPFQVRAGSRFLAALGRACGTPLPVPAFHDLADPGGMAERLSAFLSDGTGVCVTGYASSAVRIAAAARERGINLSGACFITLGEPFTEGKRRIVEDSGAKALVRYAFTEGGILGYACGSPTEPDDLHFFTDCYGITQRHRPVGGTGLRVDAFLVTSLLPPAPKILLNVETGDYGRIDARPCGCALGAAGLTTHVSGIRSFEKLSGEGMTFVQTDLLRVLEQVLPSRFGGTGADYQVVEEEQDGILKLFLTISPSVGAVDERAARDAFLEELGREGGFEQVGVEFWRRAETVTVKRDWPRATKAGKILPFQLERPQKL